MHEETTTVDGRRAMPSRPADRFEEWLRVPAPAPCHDSRFELRRAAESDFERIYDLIDAAFGKRRPRAAYEWLYRRNVCGRAQSWVVIERHSGNVVGVGSNFPWPMARGAQPITGFLNGDFAIAPNWWRRGVSHILDDVAFRHPWRARETLIGWANRKSHGSAKKLGHGADFFGPLPRGVLPLRGRAGLRALGWPSFISMPAGFLVDTVLAAWWSWRLRRDGGPRVDRVRRFDSSFDPVTERHMAWPDFWCPHDADFLNWRHLDNPSAGERIALAAIEGAAPSGYCVLEVHHERAWLTEFVAPDRPTRIRSALIAAAIDIARAAGCSYVEFFAPPGWRHWRWLRSIGFVGVRSERILYLKSPAQPRAHSVAAWQLVPGDTDTL